MKCLFGLLMLLVVAPIQAGVLHYDEAIDGHFSLQNPTSLTLKKGLNTIKGTFTTSPLRKLDAAYDDYLEFIGYGRLRPEGFDYASLAYDDSDILDLWLELQEQHKIQSVSFSILASEALVYGHTHFVSRFTIDDIWVDIFDVRQAELSDLSLVTVNDQALHLTASGKTAMVFPGWHEYIGQERVSYELTFNVIKVSEPLSLGLLSCCMFMLLYSRNKSCRLRLEQLTA
ncbi:hypothetical protein [Agarivorans albus]|uniref:Uncharacterized protein n=1 Tax=Agarivorans albus MKT 106 TaxID=1331007 RepID=R9PRM7_AGAAL|nr:hypothetical protein [Agarivorans albus]GAD04052.1 hypothetical protein AALB_4132 [Agarivorans albus MKT 106]